MLDDSSVPIILATATFCRRFELPPTDSPGTRAYKIEAYFPGKVFAFDEISVKLNEH